MFKSIGMMAVLVAAVLGQGDDSGLVGHWPLDEGSGTVLKDLGPGKHDGKLINAENSQWVEGRDGGKALEIGGPNGKAAWVHIGGFDKSLFTKGMTVMCWFRPDKEKFQRNTICHIVSDSWADGFNLAIHHRRLLLGGDGPKFTRYANSTYGKNPINPGEWMHFAATHDGDKTFKVYIDGALAGVSNDKSSGPILPAKGSVSIGSRGGYAPAYGTISQVMLYSKALDEAAILKAAQGEQ